jgi:hypothetical protein
VSKLVGDVPSATSILDRFLHHATIIAISDRSYRLRNQDLGSSSPPETRRERPRGTARAPKGAAEKSSVSVPPRSSSCHSTS